MKTQNSNFTLNLEEALLLSQALRKVPATLETVALLGRVDAIYEQLRQVAS